jgi:hypothetical protein
VAGTGRGAGGTGYRGYCGYCGCPVPRAGYMAQPALVTKVTKRECREKYPVIAMC